VLDFISTTTYYVLRTFEEQEEEEEEEHEEERDFGDDFEPGRYDHAPVLSEIDGSTDSLPTRDCASFEELANNPFAIVDHLLLPLCYGAAGGSFKEIESIPKNCRFLWSTCFAGEVCEALTDAVNFNPSEHGHPPSFELKIERRIKMFFLIPTQPTLNRLVSRPG